MNRFTSGSDAEELVFIPSDAYHWLNVQTIGLTKRLLTKLTYIDIMLSPIIIIYLQPAHGISRNSVTKGWIEETPHVWLYHRDVWNDMECALGCIRFRFTWNTSTDKGGGKIVFEGCVTRTWLQSNVLQTSYAKYIHATIFATVQFVVLSQAGSTWRLC